MLTSVYSCFSNVVSFFLVRSGQRELVPCPPLAALPTVTLRQTFAPRAETLLLGVFLPSLTSLANSYLFVKTQLHCLCLFKVTPIPSCQRESSCPSVALHQAQEPPEDSEHCFLIIPSAKNNAWRVRGAQ